MEIRVEGYNCIKLGEYVGEDEKEDIGRLDTVLVNSENIVVIKEVSSKSELLETWEEMMCLVGTYIHNNIIGKVLPKKYLWNTYLIFLTEDIIDIQTKLEIEKNKFCCKKYVVCSKSFIDMNDALIRSVPIFADLDINIEKKIYIGDERDLKEELCAGVEKKVADYFINEVQDIKDVNVMNLLKEMVGLL